MPAFLLLFNNVLQSKEWTKDQKSGCPLPVDHTWYIRLNQIESGMNNLRWISGPKMMLKNKYNKKRKTEKKQRWIIKNSITNTKHDNVIMCTVMHIPYYLFLFLTNAFILIIWAAYLILWYYKLLFPLGATQSTNAIIKIYVVCREKKKTTKTKT